MSSLNYIFKLYPIPNFFLISSVVPYATSLPCSNKAKLSANTSASSICYVVNKTHLPYLIYLIKFHICSLTIGSRPVVGSSIIKILLSPTIAIAIDNLLLRPPLKCIDS
jgi:hypothetical protein